MLHLRPLLPLLVVEFVLSFLSAIFSDALADTFIPNTHLAISLSLLPFLAGYLASRAAASLRPRHSAFAGMSLSVASFASVIFSFAFAAPAGQYLTAVAGYILSTIFIALAPQALFGFLGGWLEQKQH